MERLAPSVPRAPTELVGWHGLLAHAPRRCPPWTLQAYSTSALVAPLAIQAPTEADSLPSSDTTLFAGANTYGTAASAGAAPVLTVSTSVTATHDYTSVARAGR